MTLTQLLDDAMRRAGLGTGSTTFRDQARRHVVHFGNWVGTQADWEFRKKSSTITTVADTTTYELAADCQSLRSMRNTTRDRKMYIRDYDWLDNVDPDDSETGSPYVVIPAGIDTSTGVWEVDLFPTPDAVETLSYRYWSKMPNYTSVDDVDDLDTDMPDWLQTAVMFVVSGWLMQAKGDRSGGGVDVGMGMEMVQNAVAENTKQLAGETVRLGGTRRTNKVFDFRVQEGSLQ